MLDLTRSYQASLHMLTSPHNLAAPNTLCLIRVHFLEHSCGQLGRVLAKN
jgi:hypothetical protein